MPVLDHIRLPINRALVGGETFVGRLVLDPSKR